MKKLISIMMIACLAFNFSGCTTENDLNSPVLFQTENKSEPNFIILPTGTSRSLEKVTKKKMITVADGGEIRLEHDIDLGNGEEIEVRIELEVEANSISADAEFELSLDDNALISNVDLTFAPHGIVFSQPAKLSIRAKNLDLSGVDPNNVKVYYDNQNTGQWEEISAEEIEVKISKGEIRVKNALLNHFSRYALSKD